LSPVACTPLILIEVPWMACLAFGANVPRSHPRLAWKPTRPPPYRRERCSGWGTHEHPQTPVDTGASARGGGMATRPGHESEDPSQAGCETGCHPDMKMGTA
jgi:hypothetical protein